MSNLTKFNTQIENLLDNLSQTFPDFTDVKVFREKFNMAKKANPQLILVIFLKHIYPFKEYVIKKDEQFFLSDDLTNKLANNEELQKEGNINNEYILTKALNLKNLWKRMNNQQKETMWQYFYVLIVLCERYVNEK